MQRGISSVYSFPHVRTLCQHQHKSLSTCPTTKGPYRRGQHDFLKILLTFKPHLCIVTRASLGIKLPNGEVECRLAYCSHIKQAACILVHTENLNSAC